MGTFQPFFGLKIREPTLTEPNAVARALLATGDDRYNQKFTVEDDSDEDQEKYVPSKIKEQQPLQDPIIEEVSEGKSHLSLSSD
jgi:hypothetical protein